MKRNSNDKKINNDNQIYDELSIMKKIGTKDKPTHASGSRSESSTATVIKKDNKPVTLDSFIKKNKLTTSQRSNSADSELETKNQSNVNKRGKTKSSGKSALKEDGESSRSYSLDNDKDISKLSNIVKYENFNIDRIRYLKQQNNPDGPIVYWMSREQRVNDNWALIYAQELSIKNKQPLFVIFNLVPKFLQATLRQYDFMIKGLEKVENELSKLNIPFYLFFGNPSETIPQFVKDEKVGTLVTDFSPLKIGKLWRREIAEKIKIKFIEVDAHNIVPVWIASNKKEFAARTIREKINSKLKIYLTEFPTLKKQSPDYYMNPQEINWKKVITDVEIDKTIKPVDWIVPGEDCAMVCLRKFIKERLKTYDSLRNDPNSDGTSDLSPYLHFGQISSQRIAIEVYNTKTNDQSKKSFLEELIVRKELSDNFCFYNENYDNFTGFPDWGIKTLNEHRNDKREYVYTLEEFEDGKTHDQLWNAAQKQMVKSGKMHGYVRMYWAKKIVEWTETPEQALEFGIFLNDKYELDGRDPNGYVGVAWSVGGVHDRPWFERPVFGKIRFMNYNGMKRKINIEKYIKKWLK